MAKQQKKTGAGGKKNETAPSKPKKKGHGGKKKHEVKSGAGGAGGGGAKTKQTAAAKKESIEDRQRSYEHHDHCHKVQKKPTHTVPPKPSKFDAIGAMLAADEVQHKKEVRAHHKQLHRNANQAGLAH